MMELLQAVWDENASRWSFVVKKGIAKYCSDASWVSYVDEEIDCVKDEKTNAELKDLRCRLLRRDALAFASRRGIDATNLKFEIVE
jgi:hypothetical protein